MQYGLMMPVPLTVTSIFRHAAEFHGSAEIISRMADHTVHRYRYRDFAIRVAHLANALKELGVQPGDRVATLAWNGFRHLEIYYAVSCMGAICHTINPRLFHDQLIYIANHAEDTLLLFDVGFSGLVEKLAPQLGTVRRYVALCEEDDLQDVDLAGLVSYEAMLAAAPDSYDWPDLDERTASSLCYTSGTTGNPKGVLYDHRSTVLHAMAISGGDWLGLRARDAVLPVVPMFHANAWGIPYAGPMCGAKLVFPGHALDGRSIHELIEAERVTAISGVPTVWAELLRHLGESGGRLDSVEKMCVGGSAAPLSMIRAFEEDFGVRVLHGWGMTEMGPVGTMSAPKAMHDGRPAEERYAVSALQGRPLYGVAMRIVGDDGAPLPHDGVHTGDLQVRGPWVAGSYFKGVSPDSFTADGWFSTGDVAAIDSEGYLRLTDRTKDVIKSGGEWISSIDLENLAVGFPGVAEAACIAVPHSKWIERPLLVVVPREGAQIDTQALLASYRGKVANWWIPDHVEVIDELPHTATGKISKLALRERFRGYRLPGDR